MKKVEFLERPWKKVNSLSFMQYYIKEGNENLFCYQDNGIWTIAIIISGK